MGAVGVQLSLLNTRHKNVPVVKGAVMDRVQIKDPGGTPIIHIVKEQEFDLSGVLGIQGEIDPAVIERSSQWIAAAEQAHWIEIFFAGFHKIFWRLDIYFSLIYKDLFTFRFFGHCQINSYFIGVLANLLNVIYQFLFFNRPLKSPS